MTQSPDNAQTMEVVLPTRDLTADLAFFTVRLGFRLDTIFPADDPREAVLSGHGVRLRLDRGAGASLGVLRLPCLNPDAFAAGARQLTSPGGVRIHIVEATPPVEIPPTRHALVVRRLADGDPWVIGRAGMRYRDLIPGRLGGAVIASHIHIPDAGPVPDMVHFHDVGFQLIFCAHGWVRVVYEDQGPPFVLKAGDCVIQPPRIRHRVLEASENLQVIELSVPAEHVTTMDHEMALPTPASDPGRRFGGQTFRRSQADAADWLPWRLSGFEARETGISVASAGAASVRVARPAGQGSPIWTSHNANILFGFIWSGSLTLHAQGHAAQKLSAGDSFVIPLGMKTALMDSAPDLQLLEVSLPAAFETVEHEAIAD
ncbi:MAG: cupin [Vicinamibacteria bacterium]|nr:cupin [Vicinamibacteria bacterium]